MLKANSISEAISTLFGPSVTVVDRQRVSGGDINRAYRLGLSSGECVFLKCNRAGLLDMFTAEAHGLDALRATGTIGVPEPLAVGADNTEAFLIMDYLAPARAAPTIGRPSAASLQCSTGRNAAPNSASRPITTSAPRPSKTRPQTAG